MRFNVAFLKKKKNPQEINLISAWVNAACTMLCIMYLTPQPYFVLCPTVNMKGAVLGAWTGAEIQQRGQSPYTKTKCIFHLRFFTKIKSIQQHLNEQRQNVHVLCPSSECLLYYWCRCCQSGILEGAPRGYIGSKNLPRWWTMAQNLIKWGYLVYFMSKNFENSWFRVRY